MKEKSLTKLENMDVSVPDRTNSDGQALSEMLRRGELFNQNCPSREILKHLTSRWGVLVLIALLDRDHRFSDLRRKVGGVSEKMLAQTLQTLEADGFVNRFSHPVVPPHVDYSLTPIGREVALKVRDFADWIEVNITRILSSRSVSGAASE
ncbi:DNA-binding HxlR family transcriptional regulator [Labrenzia sp. EL_208]|nr:DNA-binding HxlR family transcriptional regulator [Labrenzia sp. EL_132]MBG6202943.1 DNA-binding HxlR family transcriptional regulator [Labrenzia sp. EL_13]MBG6227157.1 DNA-binding HxlR family transcriptional regulator [Labrenzia sp. EL_208]